MNAFKRITVEFTHEVDGNRKSEKLDFVRRCNTGISFGGPSAFELYVTGVLQEMGVINPEIVRIDQRRSEPPLFEL